MLPRTSIPHASGTPSAPIDHDFEVDETQLLEETEELLNTLDAKAFQDDNTSHAGVDELMIISHATSDNEIDMTSIKQEEVSPAQEHAEQEIQQLQLEIERLEEQLRAFQERPASNSTIDNKEDIDCNRSSMTMMERQWRWIVKRQLAGRQKAEKENEQLKASLAAQRKFASQLQDMLRLRSALRNNRVRLPAALLDPPLAVDYSDIHMLDSLTAELDAVYAGMEQESKSIDNNSNYQPVGTPENVEVKDSRVVPFGLDIVAHAIWKAIKKLHLQHSRVLYPHVDRPETTIAMQYRAECQHSQTSMLNVKLVVRKYVESDRVVFVWRSQSCSDGQFHGVYTDEHGWVAVTRMTGVAATVADASDSTFVQSYAHVIPKSDDRKPINNTAAKESDSTKGLMDAVLGLYVDDMEWITRQMENVALEQQLHVGNDSGGLRIKQEEDNMML